MSAAVNREIYRAGAAQYPQAEYRESENEITALEDALELAHPGDVIIFMAHEFLPELTARLIEISI